MNGKTAALFSILALVSSPAVQAADAVYLGDCQRAQVIQQQSTIDRLLPHGGYEGVAKLYQNSGWMQACKTEQLQSFTLKLRSRSTSAVQFDATRSDINFDRKAGCAAPKLNSSGVSGTVTFTTKLDQKGELCELYIWSDWKLKLAGNDSWSGNFSNRVLSMDGGAFTIAQRASDSGSYITPISFTGVNP